MRFLALVSFLALGCQAQDTSSKAQFLDAAAFGAIPDDGVDDTLALRAALQGDHKVVRLSSGVYNLTKQPNPYNPQTVLDIHGKDVRLEGVSDSVLSLSGSLGYGATYVISVDPGADRITLAGFRMDTMGATETEEQTHAIQIGSGAGQGIVRGVTVSGLSFTHGRVSADRKGDCIRVVGADAARAVYDVVIRDNTALACQRSFVVIQRNVHGLTIADNTVYDVGDTPIDAEITGLASEVVDGVIISRNQIYDTGEAQGAYAITLGGAAPMTNVVVSQNQLSRRGIQAYRVKDTVITGNTIRHQAVSLAGSISIGSAAERVVVSSNTITRTGAAGPTVRLFVHAGNRPVGVTIANNALLGGGILSEEGKDLTIMGNLIVAPGAYPVDIRGVSKPPGKAIVIGNQLTGLTHSLGPRGVLWNVRPAAQSVENELVEQGNTLVVQ